MGASAPTPSVADQVARSRQCQPAWAALPVAERLRPIRRFRHLLVREADALCAAVVRDIGKTADETLGSDLLPLAEACRFLERRAARLLRPRRISRWDRPLWMFGQTDIVYRRPRGVVGIIGTWNYPLLLNGVQMVQALTAGNGVVMKPSEFSTASAAMLDQLIHEAGIPADLVQLLPATRDAGAQLASAGVNHIVFTGSATTGKALAKSLAEHLVSSTMELSGCDALFVLADADVALAARAAWFGATANRGQTCLASRRALVHRSVYPAFLDALRPLAQAAPLVSLVTAGQRQQAERLVREALDHGARLLDERAVPAIEGANPFRPAVLVDAPPEMALCQEDSFAPLLAVMPFDMLDEALRIHDACRYGLGASVFTADRAAAEGLAARLDVGMVTVNDVVLPTAHPATPMGGRGESGWGITQGAEGLLEMTEPQVVSHGFGRFRPHYDLAAGGRGGVGPLLRGLLEWQHGASWGQRWRGLVGVVRAARSLKGKEENHG